MHRAKFLLPEGTLLFTTGGQDGNMSHEFDVFGSLVTRLAKELVPSLQFNIISKGALTRPYGFSRPLFMVTFLRRLVTILRSLIAPSQTSVDLNSKYHPNCVSNYASRNNSHVDEELHELGKIFNLINSNSAEGISEYFQSLDSCNSIDGDYDLATKRKEDQQREIDKFVSISLRFSDRGKLISSVRDMEATFGYATVIKKSKLILLNRWVLQVYDKYHKVPLGLKADMHEKISNIVDFSIPYSIFTYIRSGAALLVTDGSTFMTFWFF
ncbi:hypothetical protein POM88_054053 [Heracleum sosnowskyi]|uniref:Uncharacterized protein n=1 Tax=Heracleum sosnowskyi TaxID=360622 RepID=A0AAD8GN04_9APIA|nr:hypothetical protein POM88_054053 [Heracleum sosnowskyi]